VIGPPVSTEKSMGSSDLDQGPPRLVFAPTCGCAEHEVMAWRDEDGDWICGSCGRLLTPSLTALRALRSAVYGPEPRAA
jgi:hypothetical protein